jgi:cell surface protein SprA
VLSEFARIFLIGIVLFYAAINLGFLSPYQSQVNQGIWVNAFYNIIEKQKSAELQKLSELNQYDNRLEKPSPKNDEGLKQLTIPLNLSSDSTSHVNVPPVSTVVQKDSGNVKDTVTVKNNSSTPPAQPAVPQRTVMDTTKNYFNTPPAQVRSGQPRDTSRFRDSLAIRKTISEFKDSLGFRRDTSKVDSMAIDSTARLKYMNYARQDVPNVQLSLQNEGGLIAVPSETVARRVIAIDSTGRYVEIKDMVGNAERKVLLRMPLEDYINLQLSMNETNIWQNNFNSMYLYKGTKRELGELIKDITSFEIPLPSVGVLSIFGKPIIKLTIGGAVDIHAAWNSTTTQGVTTSALGNTQNEPSFQQQVQINVDGEIGDKLNIHADWNTERTFEYQNMLHIKYSGYEDEIIQSIEAGNVSMQASPLVGGSEALFGIKAQFKMGPVVLTTLASQKKGETKQVSVNSGTQSSTFTIRAYNYATNNFFVDTVYARTDKPYNIFNNYYGNAVAFLSQPGLKIVQMQVWKSVNTTIYDLSKERKANAYINALPPIPVGGSYPDTLRSDFINPVPGISETGRFVLLTEGSDYTFEPNTGYITFLTTVNDADIIAVAYQIYNNTDPNASGKNQIGEFIKSGSVDSSRIVLKLVKPAYLKPQFTTAWKLLLKNIYSVNATNIKQDGFELHIKYETPGQDAVTTLPIHGTQVQLLNAFGLDKYDAGGNLNPDDKFDWRPQITVLPAAGEIIFPTLQPFSYVNLNAGGITDSSLSFQSVYDTSSYYASQDQTHDKWSISGKYSGDASSVYQLGFNVVENSVKVTLNGKTLSLGSDYSVDYNTGQLTILNSNATSPGADLKISFEQNDLFSLASKSLLGARAVVNVSDKTKLGFSILNLNEQTLNDKVRIGEEPLKNTMMGVDFNTSADLPFLTDALDKIISTGAMSSFTFAGEYAHMSPDPNTLKSTISDDGGQSIAYIDDFEGSKKIIPIGVGYTAWKDLSEPGLLNKYNGDSTFQYLKDQNNSLMRYKAKSWWYSVTPSNVNIKDIWGTKKQVATSDQQEPVMDYFFKPDAAGSYNMNPKLDTLKHNWGGMMKVLSGTANDLKAANMQYIEFWLYTQNAPPKAKLYIDLGRISEDVIPDRKLNTEDINNNGVIDQGEDIGLDGMTDAQEKDSVGKMGYSPQDPNDPNNDDFNLSSPNPGDPNSYYHVNGTEGNSILTDIGRIPDTEDLNNNGTLDVVNSYYRYAVPLDTIEAKSTGIVASAANVLNGGWHLYRIPLQNYIDSVGTPTLSDVEYIRVFATGVADPIHVRLAEFNLTGNQWQQVIPYDPVMAVSVINVEDNPNYNSPPGLQREQDRTITTSTVYKNEQSMDLIVKGLQAGDKREAVEYLARTLDVFSYSAMKIFFHGDETPGANIAGTTSGKSNAEVYLRFGTDTSNFYEYRQPIQPGWNDVNILFKELASIKEARDSVRPGITDSVLVSGYNDRYYGIRGNPSLTAIKFLTVGIRNRTNQTIPTPLSGEVWVNELRVIGADNHSGNAYTVSTSLKLADLLSVSFNMSHSDAWFHSLSDQFGSRNDTKNWSLAASLDVLKLLPFNMSGSSLNLNYSHSESIQTPRYEPGTDILIDAVITRANSNRSDTTSKTNNQTAAQIISGSQTMSTSDSWSLGNIVFKIPDAPWYIRDSFNSLSYTFNYNKTFSRSPTILSNSTWVWNAGVNYSVNASPENYVMPEKIPLFGSILGFLTDYKELKIYYTPQSFSFNFAARRNRAYTTSRATTGNDTSAATSIFNHDFSTSRGFNFSWKFTDGGILNLATDYSASFNSSLADLETGGGTTLLPEREIWRKIFSGSFFGKDFSFQQNLNFRVTPKLPSIWDIDKNFNINASYSVGYQWAHNFSAISTLFDSTTGKSTTTDAGRSAGFQNKSQVSLRISLKAMMDPLFASDNSDANSINGVPGNNLNRNNAPAGNPLEAGNPQEPGNPAGNNPEKRQRTFGEEAGKNPKDTTKIGNIEKGLGTKQGIVRDSTVKVDSLVQTVVVKKSPLKNAEQFLKIVAKTLFFDYESINVNFSNSSSVSKSALADDGTGFSNFWGFKINKSNGPSRLFMLGLSSDVGDRVGNLSTITDVFSQSNNIDVSTSRPLWTGAKIDLSWKVGWTLNKSTPLTTDFSGLMSSAGPITSTGTISRSFFALPIGLLNSGIKQVHKLYGTNTATDSSGQSLSNAFIKGFETLPLLSRLSFLQSVTNYVPRPNWTISWDGLEKFFPFKAIAEKVSLDHSYNSSYSEGWYLDPDGKKVTQTQQINYAFAPLIGLNMTFGKLWSGSLSGNIKYSTSSTYALGVSTSNITDADTKDIGISATYTKSGFELPVFGVSLKNDIEFTFSYTFSQSSTVLYNMDPLQYSDAGTPQDGQTRVTIEPRVKYTISSKVTLAIFYTRTTVQPAGASRVTPTTSNQAGLDVHIAIGG